MSWLGWAVLKEIRVQNLTTLSPYLRDPATGEKILSQGARLVVDGSNMDVKVDEYGIPLFASNPDNEDSAYQQAHYDEIHDAYTQNLTYPHTQEYMRHLDDALVAALQQESIGTLVEVCCGTGESFKLADGGFDGGIGVDISHKMLRTARSLHPDRKVSFVQGDAICLPIADGIADTVVMLGGIHHVNDRARLFSEVSRILKPGGRFIWREPVSDFFLWRWIRAAIYRVSPLLDHQTEAPLELRTTEPPLRQAGFRLESWKTWGLFGFAFFMNSDVLVFNRLFRFIPGIVHITRAFARLDDLMLALPGLKRAGLQVIGIARKDRKPCQQ